MFLPMIISNNERVSPPVCRILINVPANSGYFFMIADDMIMETGLPIKKGLIRWQSFATADL